MQNLKYLIYAVCLSASLSLAVAADAKPPKKKALTEEQKKLRKELLDKYDANKDGKLSRDERNKMSDTDKEKLKKAGLAQGKKKNNAKHDKGSTDSSGPVKTQ